MYERHATTFGAPREMFDVVVSGLGPVGVTLAGLLACRGLRVRAVDPAADPYDIPRAVGFDHEAMRVFQEIGVADDLADFVDAYRPSEYRTAAGEVIRRFESQQPPYPLSWPPYATFLQPPFERALRARAASLPGLSIRYGVELRVVDSVADDPVVTLRETGTGETWTEGARFVVGCDGGNSFLRKFLGIGLEDLEFDEPWLVVDVLLGEGALRRLPDVNVQYCDPRRPHTFVVCAKNLRRWEFRVMPGEDPAEMARPETVWRLLEPWLAPGEATLWRAATYRFHALVARTWRRGRVLLAGDACHMTPPFLAQGMVQGVKDAANLAWKIAAVRDGAPDALLDTYEAERRPHVVDVIRTTKELGRIIGETDPGHAAERDACMRAAMAAGRGTTVRQNLFPPLRGGALAAVDATPCVGCPAPQPWVRDGDGFVRLDVLTGAVFRLLALPSFGLEGADLAGLAAMAVPAWVVAEDGRPGSVAERDGVFAHWMSEAGVGAILVRPDHIVFAALADRGGLRAALDELAAWLPVTPPRAA